MGAPAFDSSQPFDVESAPAFDPAKPHDVEGEPKRAEALPASDKEVAMLLDWARRSENADKPLAKKLRAADEARLHVGDRAVSRQVGGIVSPETAGTLTDMGLKGANAGALGWLDEAAAKLGPGDYKANRDAFRNQVAAREQRFDDNHGLLTRAAVTGASALPAALATPAGYAGAAAGGAVAGLGGSVSETLGGQALDTGIGATAGAVGQAVANGGLALGKKGLGWVIEMAGKTGQKPEAILARIFGKAAPQAVPVDDMAVRAAQHASVMDDVAAANPMQVGPAAPRTTAPVSVNDLPEEMLFDRVAKQGAQNAERVAPMEPMTPATREARMRALDQIANWGAEKDAELGMANARTSMPTRAEAQARIAQINRDIATRNDKRGVVPDAVTRNERVGSVPPQVVVPVRDEITRKMGARELDSALGFEPEIARTPSRPPSAIDAVSEFFNRDVAARSQPESTLEAITDDELGLNYARMRWDKDTNPRTAVQAAEQTITPAAATERQPSAAMPSKRQAIIDAQMANPEALAAFGVDPRAGERGFLDLGTAYAGYKGIKVGIPLASKALAEGGRKLEAFGHDMQTPENLAKSWLSNPSLLAPLAQRQDNLGEGARYVLEGLQQSGQTGLKARLFILQSQPWFRAMSAQHDSDATNAAPLR